MDNSDKVIQVFLESPRRTVFRYVAGSWWAYDDGYWILDQGAMRIDRAIVSVIEEIGWDKGTQTYIRNRIRARLSGWLPSLKLPGRLEDNIVPSIVRTPPASEPPAP
jgi:hypothetical protein